MAALAPIEKTIYKGTFVHSRSLDDLEICVTGAIGVDEDGAIAFVERENADAKHAGWENAKIVALTKYQFFFPGFIDTHIHASQYPNAGIFGKSTLLDWLNTYTFPLESSLGDVAKATTVYSRCVDRTLSHGTTTAAYYATIHPVTTNLLADICLAKGQRAFIGRVCMDSMSPDYYKDESVEQAMVANRATFKHIKEIDPTYEIVCPIITPRFAPSCSNDMLTALGHLHKETGFPCQTHIAENKLECQLVKKLFPQCSSYTDVYDSYGLLTDKMILAHAIHLNTVEMDTIKEKNAKISHCPASNSALTSGGAKVRLLLDRGIDVGLGTDMSGGYSPSMLEAVRASSLVSRHVAMADGEAAKLSIEEVLYLGTRGGAKVVGLAEKIGGFDVGMQWDAQLIALEYVGEEGTPPGAVDLGPVDVFGWESDEDRIAKWVFNGDDRNTRKVWVKGRLVHETK